jgi:hypothetical protein
MANHNDLKNYAVNHCLHFLPNDSKQAGIELIQKKPAAIAILQAKANLEIAFQDMLSCERSSGRRIEEAIAILQNIQNLKEVA